MIYTDDEGFLQYDVDAWEEERTEPLHCTNISLEEIEYYLGMGGCSE